MASNSLKAMLPCLQSTKVSWESDNSKMKVKFFPCYAPLYHFLWWRHPLLQPYHFKSHGNSPLLDVPLNVGRNVVVASKSGRLKPDQPDQWLRPRLSLFVIILQIHFNFIHCEVVCYNWAQNQNSNTKIFSSKNFTRIVLRENFITSIYFIHALELNIGWSWISQEKQKLLQS